MIQGENGSTLGYDIGVYINVIALIDCTLGPLEILNTSKLAETPEIFISPLNAINRRVSDRPQTEKITEQSD